MKEQLTFEQYREIYIPNWRNVRCSGWNDPNEGWYYNWLESGHAEECQKQEKEYRQKILEQSTIKKAQEAFIEKIWNEATSNKTLEEILGVAYGKNWKIRLKNDYIEKIKIRESLLNTKGNSC